MSIRPWPLRLSNITFCSPLSALSCLTYVCRHGVADIRSRISSAFSSAYPQVVLNVNIYAYRAPRRGCPSMHAYCQTSICNTIHRTREKFFNGSFVARLRGCSGLPTTSIYNYTTMCSISFSCSIDLFCPFISQFIFPFVTLNILRRQI